MAALAPTGRLRVGLNTANALLVRGQGADGTPEGVAPDIGRAVAARLGVPAEFVSYPSPGAVADAAGQGAWDIALLGAEPERAGAIAFAPAICAIEAALLVRPGVGGESLAALDRPGIRIAAMGRAAYGLWLARHLRAATLAGAESIPAAAARFEAEGLEALAGLRAGLAEVQARIPGARILPAPIMTVRQALGVARARVAALPWIAAFAREARASGLVAGLIARHGATGLAVAAPDPAEETAP